MRFTVNSSSRRPGIRRSTSPASRYLSCVPQCHPRSCPGNRRMTFSQIFVPCFRICCCAVVSGSPAMPVQRLRRTRSWICLTPSKTRTTPCSCRAGSCSPCASPSSSPNRASSGTSRRICRETLIHGERLSSLQLPK